MATFPAPSPADLTHPATFPSSDLNLETLALTSNQFATVPKEIYSLDKLEILWLSYNQISTLPGKLFKSLKNLKKFSCGFSLINSIPSEIKYCKNLEKMVIKCNGIKYLPIELKKITTLQSLEFYDNPVISKTKLTPVNFPIEDNMMDKKESLIDNNKSGIFLLNDEKNTITSVPSLFEICARSIKKIKRRKC